MCLSSAFGHKVRDSAGVYLLLLFLPAGGRFVEELSSSIDEICFVVIVVVTQLTYDETVDDARSSGCRGARAAR